MLELLIEEPLVSVVVPAFNGASYVWSCLKSLVAQTYKNIEIIVVDDGSTDDTAKIVTKYFPQVEYVWQKNSGGCSSPRNHGIRVAKGRYIAFFDVDDVMEPQCIESHVRGLKRFPGTQVSVTNYQNFDDATGKPIGTDHFETCALLKGTLGVKSEAHSRLPGTSARRILAEENFSIASGLMASKEMCEKLSGFDEELAASEDFDFVYRAAVHSDLVVEGGVGFQRRMHETNMSRQMRKIIMQKIRSRKKLLSLEKDQQTKKVLRKSLRNFYLAAANSKEFFGPRERLASVCRAVEVSRSVSGAHVRSLAKIALAR